MDIFAYITASRHSILREESNNDSRVKRSSVGNAQDPYIPAHFGQTEECRAIREAMEKMNKGYQSPKIETMP